MSLEFGLRIAERKEDYSSVHKFGQNTGLAATPETIWSPGGLYPWSALTSAQPLYVLSTSGSDTGSLEIQGLDANYSPLNETIIMTGTTAVTTSNAFLRVFRCIYRGSTNLGTITLRTVSASGTIVAQVDVEEAQTLMAVYTIPAGFLGYLKAWTAGVGKNDDASLKLYARPFDQVFQIQDQIKVYQSTFTQTFTVPIFLNQKTDIDVRATTTAANSSCNVSFDLILHRI